MKYLIRFFCDWCSSSDLKKGYEKIWETNKLDNYGPEKDIYITDNDTYTHAIILNKASPKLTIPIENCIGLAYEPPEFLKLNTNFINYTTKYLKKYYIGTIKSFLPKNFIEQYSFMPHFKPIDFLPEKTKLISIVFSQKGFAPGHKYRHLLVSQILISSLPIDIYGNGCKTLKSSDPRIKGSFNNYEPYLDYKFTICIENFRHNAYFSEKIINPLLTNTIPVYLGCHKIENYFPNMIVYLTGIIKQDMELLIHLCKNPNFYQKTIDIDLVKNKTNLIKNLDYLFS